MSQDGKLTEHDDNFAHFQDMSTFVLLPGVVSTVYIAQDLQEMVMTLPGVSQTCRCSQGNGVMS